MGASDLTTEIPGTGNGEVVDGGRPGSSNGHVSKKRKREKALAAVVANGHVSKVAQRKNGRSNGAVVIDEPPAAVPVADEPEDALPDGPTVQAPAVEELDDAVEAAVVEEVDEAEAEPAEEEEALDELAAGRKARRRAAKRADDEALPADSGRRARKRAAKAAAPPRGRAAKRASAAQRATPAGRRAQLVATSAEIAAAVAAAEAQPEATGRKRAAKYTRRLVALIAVAMIPASAYALVVTDGPVASLSRADAVYMSAQLMTADQRVRRQLARLKPQRTSPAVARTRDAQLTARSLDLELANAGGKDAARLRRALKLEAAWLDAVGSVLSNPRSALRGELVARDAALRPALNALPVPEARRKGGAKQLVRYAKSRVAAARSSRR